MEEATISHAPPAQEPLYQQGRFPSIIDTDDIVFELGKQLVGSINKEKLLDNLFKKSKMLENAMIEAGKAKAIAEMRVTELELSNEQYIENNQRLDAELVKVRNELVERKNALRNSETSLDEMQEAMIELENELEAKDKEIQKLEKTPPQKKIIKKKTVTKKKE